MTTERRVFLAVYALSGCAALIYEVAWMRLLTLHMGRTVAAVSTVLAAFMGGMAAGTIAAGARAGRLDPARALRLYAWLEFSVAGSALLVRPLLAALTPLLAAAYANGDGGGSFALVRTVSSFIVVAVPAAAMGASFPVATRWIVEDVDRAGASAGGLYAANTTGAACGAAAAAFLVIPAFGLRLTTWIAVSLNVIAGAAALSIARRARRSAAPLQAGTMRVRPRRGLRENHSSGTASAGHVRTAAFAAGITGFVALVNEVAWTRVLSLAFGPTTYAFGSMLCVTIAGLAAGSAIAANVVDRIRRPLLALAALMVATGAATVAAMSYAGGLPMQVATTVSSPGTGFGELLRLEVWAAAVLLLPLTLALGAAFPAALRAAAHEGGRIAYDVSVVYAINTAGAIAGSIAGGFLLIPLLGLQRTIQAASLATFAGALAVVTLARPRRLIWLVWAIAIAAFAAATLAVPPWDMALLSSGAYKYARYVRGPDLESALHAGRTLYYREGAAATVAVRRLAGTTSLSIEGKVDASNGGDMLTQKLLAHLPLMMHGRAGLVAVIGLGSGVTAGAALTHSVDRVDVIEISPEVVEASAFFDRDSRAPLKDPRTRLIVGDGRSHLLLTHDRYDVIVSEPSNPWMAGVAALFTREFFAAARRALTADGILCQWTHTYDMSEADLKSIVATFASVFPEGTMWLVGESDVLLIGSPAGAIGRLNAMRAAFRRPEVASDLRTVDAIDADSLFGLYAAGPAEMRAYADGAPLQTDDRMALEFSAPRSIVGGGESHNAEIITALSRTDSLPAEIRDAIARPSGDVWRRRGTMLLKAEAYSRAYEAFSRAVAADLRDEISIDGLTKAAGPAGRIDDAFAIVSTIADRDPQNVPAHIASSRIAAGRGDVERAVEAVRPLMVTIPDDPRVFEQAASVLADAADVERLAPLVDELRRRWPDRTATRYYSAALALLQGRWADVEAMARAARADGGVDAKLYNLAGIASAAAGRRTEARRAFESAVEADPRDPSGYVNLGLLHLQSGDPVAALNLFAEALILDPGSRGAREGLAGALTQLGESTRASRVLAESGR